MYELVTEKLWWLTLAGYQVPTPQPLHSSPPQLDKERKHKEGLLSWDTDPSPVTDTEKQAQLGGN